MDAFYGFEVDQAEVAALLKSSEFTSLVQQAAEQVAEAARAQDHRVTSGEPLPVDVVDDPGRDRAGFTVAIRHPAGIGMEAHHGVLKRAAHEAGLDVHGLETP